jgi:hypothetical protein
MPSKQLIKAFVYDGCDTFNTGIQGIYQQSPPLPQTQQDAAIQYRGYGNRNPQDAKTCAYCREDITHINVWEIFAFIIHYKNILTKKFVTGEKARTHLQTLSANVCRHGDGCPLG